MSVCTISPLALWILYLVLSFQNWFHGSTIGEVGKCCRIYVPLKRHRDGASHENQIEVHELPFISPATARGVVIVRVECVLSFDCGNWPVILAAIAVCISCCMSLQERPRPTGPIPIND